MTNNDILKKLRIALQLRNEEIVRILGLVDFSITESELSAVFRAEDHENFKECGDQLLRNFLNGLIIEKRGVMEPKADHPVKSERTKYDSKEPNIIPFTPRKQAVVLKKKTDESFKRKVFVKKKGDAEAENKMYEE